MFITREQLLWVEGRNKYLNKEMMIKPWKKQFFNTQLKCIWTKSNAKFYWYLIDGNDMTSIHVWDSGSVMSYTYIST